MVKLYLVIQNGNLHSPHESLEDARKTIQKVGGWNDWDIYWWSDEDYKFHKVNFNGGAW